MRQAIKSIPILGPGLRYVYRTWINPKAEFIDSKTYWINRYKKGGNSGAGSYRKLAEFKAEVLSRFVSDNSVQTVIEFGCGDGNQLSMMNFPEYIGYDISPDAIALCEEKFNGDTSKQFKLINEFKDEKANLSLSLDVIFHLIEDQVFEDYMQNLFNASNKYVIIYSSNKEDTPSDTSAHVKHRKFSNWIEENRPDWQLREHIPNKFPYSGDNKNGSFADFYIYELV